MTVGRDTNEERIALGVVGNAASNLGRGICPASLHIFLIPWMIATAISCQPRPFNTEHFSAPTSKHVTFKGVVRDARYNRLHGVIRCFTDSGNHYGAGANVRDGSFSFSLPRTMASRISHFEVTSYGFDTLLQPIDKSSLRDSVILLDFILTLRPAQYSVVIGFSPHSTNTTYDTTWLDRSGRKVTKAYSDSVWQNNPP